MHSAEFPLLTVGQFGLLAAQFPPGAGDGHALAGAQADEIGLELGEGGEDIEEHLAHGIVRVVERSSEGQFHAAFLKLVGDGAGIRDGPGEAVEFGHDQGVALAYGGEGLVEAGAGAAGAGESVVGVDAIWGDAEFQEGLSLGGQILPVGGAARVSDEGCGHEGCDHWGKCTNRVPHPQLFPYHSYETLLVPVWRRSERRAGPYAGRTPYGQCRANTGLNKGEARHALRIGRQGEIRGLSSEGRRYRMADLNLLAAIVIYWNTAHLGEAVGQRKHVGLTVEPELLAHILLTGEYQWSKRRWRP